jgi:hypothetical protein
VRKPDELRAAFTPVQAAHLLLRAVGPGDVDAVLGGLEAVLVEFLVVVDGCEEPPLGSAG